MSRMTAIILFTAAYIAEVVRGGLQAMPRGQFEAADSLGLNYNQTMRLIILPQALKISIPGIVNVAVGLVKDTTLVSVISRKTDRPGGASFTSMRPAMSTRCWPC